MHTGRRVGIYQNGRRIAPCYIQRPSTGPNRRTRMVCQQKIRLIYDKGYHGVNRAKNLSLSPEDREVAQTCLLCQKPGSKDHWIQ